MFKRLAETGTPVATIQSLELPVGSSQLKPTMTITHRDVENVEIDTRQGDDRLARRGVTAGCRKSALSRRGPSFRVPSGRAWNGLTSKVFSPAPAGLLAEKHRRLHTAATGRRRISRVAPRGRRWADGTVCAGL